MGPVHRSAAGLVLTAALAAALQVGCAAPPAWPGEGRWVDLTHDFAEDTVVWPTSDRFRLQVLTAGDSGKGYYYAANAFQTAEHGGTHVDAPIHFGEGRRTVEQLPIDQLIGPAVVVDVRAAVDADIDYEVDTVDLMGWETRHGPIPEGAIVLLRTGQGLHWPDAAAYLGTARRGPEALAELHFPGLAPAAAEWLVSERSIGAVGIDTASIDRGPSTTYGSHVVLAAHDVAVFENVARLEDLPEAGARVVALPMKIRGGTGGPLRIVAWIPASPRGP